MTMAPDSAHEAFYPRTPASRSALVAWLGRCIDRYAQRKTLAELDDALLRDIGLTPEDVRRECAKPFWR